MYKVYLSLGSNLGDKELNLDKAIRNIEVEAGNIISRSSFYYSEPWGFESDNGFVNICTILQTGLSPEELLKLTKSIEKELGRLKKSEGSYADRIIDIDLIFIDDMVIDTPELVVPHPLMHLRDFVLVPMAEIAGDFIHPVFQKNIEQLANNIQKG